MGSGLHTTFPYPHPSPLPLLIDVSLGGPLVTSKEVANVKALWKVRLSQADGVANTLGVARLLVKLNMSK